MRYGIMFDMDNTLLRSRIDFKGMRDDLLQLLITHQVGTVESYEQEMTAAQVIEKGKKLMAHLAERQELEQKMDQIVVQYELEGMKEAPLEKGVRSALAYLKGKGLVLTVVTNNAYSAAAKALKTLGVFEYFNMVVGRDQMEALKPSPSGVQVVLKQFPHVKHWVMLGDSWIDGKAAQTAGVDFVAYQADIDHMHHLGVYPVDKVDDFAGFVRWVDQWLALD